MMDAKYFAPKLKPSDEPDLKVFERSTSLVSILKDSFKVQTLFAIGASIQTLICFTLPLRWAVIPSCALLLNSVVTTILQIRNPGSYLSKKIIPGRTSALIPSPLTGRDGPQPSGEGLVVFHLGTQANHPLGIGGPGWDKMGEYFNPMIKDLRERKDEYGLISMSEWTSSDRESHNTKLWTFYFRDLEGLHKFAHGALHRKGWDGYHKGKNWNKNIGIFHETYVVQPGGYETVYVNSYPVLLGRGTVKAPTDGGEKYVNTLVGADVPALKTQWTRLGRDADGKAKEVHNA